jgi:hypothetical protein
MEQVVGRIDQQNHLDRRLTPAAPSGTGCPVPGRAVRRPERKYRLRFLIIQEPEVLLREAGHRMPGSIGHQHIESDSSLRRFGLGPRPMREFRTIGILPSGRRGTLLGKRRTRNTEQHK